MIYLRFACVVVISSTLIGCGSSGGSGGSEVSRVISGANALNIGTQGAQQPGTGLPFAADAIDDDSGLLDGPIRFRFVRFVTDYDNDRSFVVVTEEQLTFSEDAMGDLQERVSFNGEVIQLTDGEGVLSNGQDLVLVLPEFGEYAFLVNLFTYSNSFTSGFDSDGFGVVGFETKPEDIPTSGGATTYSGGFTGYSNALALDGSIIADAVELSGDVSIDVNFDTHAVGGFLQFVTIDNDIDVPTVVVDLLLDETNLQGNGFATTTSVNTCPAVRNCTSEVRIGGAFFGPEADELSGLVEIDYTEADIFTDPDLLLEESVRIVGAGGFIAEEVSEIVISN